MLTNHNDNFNLFLSLPSEIIHQILEHFHAIELMISIARVCHVLREEFVFKLIVKDSEFRNVKFVQQFTNMNDLYCTREGKRFIKYLFRKYVMDISYCFYHHQIVNESSKRKQYNITEPSLQSELEFMKYYYGFFSNSSITSQDNKKLDSTESVYAQEENATKSSNQESTGFFSYLFNMFSKSKDTKHNNSIDNITSNSESDLDLVIKVSEEGRFCN